MDFEKVSIVSVRHVDAPHRVTSAEIQERLADTMERLNLKPDLLEAVAGIRERRYWDEGFQPSDAATLAAQAVFDDTGLDPAKLGLPAPGKWKVTDPELGITVKGRRDPKTKEYPIIWSAEDQAPIVHDGKGTITVPITRHDYRHVLIETGK